jgi:hypothetical protein
VRVVGVLAIALSAVALVSVASATEYKGDVLYWASVTASISDGKLVALRGQSSRIPCQNGETADPVPFTLSAPVPLVNRRVHAEGTSVDVYRAQFKWSLDAVVSQDGRKIVGTLYVSGESARGACSGKFPVTAIVPPHRVNLPLRRTFQPADNNRSFNPSVEFDYRKGVITHLTAHASTLCPEGSHLGAELNTAAYRLDPIRLRSGRFRIVTDVLDDYGVVTHVVLTGTIKGAVASGRIDSRRRHDVNGRFDLCELHAPWVSRASASAGTGPDTVAPRVLVYPGSATRGKIAFIDLRVSDNSGSVRLRVSLSYHGHEVVYGLFGWQAVNWSQRQSFFTQGAFPAGLPVGAYSACVRAWDRTGNSAHDCAPYQVR